MGTTRGTGGEYARRPVVRVLTLAVLRAACPFVVLTDLTLRLGLLHNTFGTSGTIFLLIPCLVSFS